MSKFPGYLEQSRSPVRIVTTTYSGLDGLIRAKVAAGRAQDLADVKVLRRAKFNSRKVGRNAPRSRRRD